VRELMEDTHMSLGVLLTLVIVARLVWRWMPGHQVESIERGWVKLASTGTHYLLYALLVAEAALGFTFRWGAGRPMEFFGLGIPPLIGEPDFIAGAWPFAILMLGVILASPYLPFNQVLLMAALPGWHTGYTLATVAVSVAGNAVLIPLLGMRGAALAAAASLALSAQLLRVLARSRVGLRI